jgi:hypothetical protein
MTPRRPTDDPDGTGPDAGSVDEVSTPNSSRRPDEPLQAFPTVPLDVRRPVAAQLDLRRVMDAFEDLAWLGPATTLPDSPERRALELDIGFGVAADAVTIRKAAIAELGRPRIAGDAITVEVTWRAATFAPLFPVFAGRLVIATDHVGLHGRYAPPFGRLGLLVDRALLHLVATGTASAFVARVVAGLDAAQGPAE